MKKILVPIDFSEASHCAKNLADTIATHTGAALHFLKVIQTSSDIVITYNDH